jgi:5-methylcytosine-specific restriction endonuclease McrA
MVYFRSKVKRTEEQKRNLKIDINSIPKWEAEIQSARARFGRFNLAEFKSAVVLIHEVRNKVFSLPTIPKIFNESYEFNTTKYRAYKLDSTQYKDLINWLDKLETKHLVNLSNRLSTPAFFRMEYYIAMNVDFIKELVEYYENNISEYKAVETTNNRFIAITTNKIHINEYNKNLKYLEYDRNAFATWLSTLQSQETIAAIRLIDDVECESSRYSVLEQRNLKLLADAKEKKEAIEKFESKHGKAFAKAAASDNKTRNRAESMKCVVKKTNECPYCGNSLGSNPHLDHIYPVSKGGLSIVENLIWCCSTCNSLKTDKGLIQFINERKLKLEQVVSLLHSLGKHI